MPIYATACNNSGWKYHKYVDKLYAQHLIVDMTDVSALTVMGVATSLPEMDEIVEILSDFGGAGLDSSESRLLEQSMD